MELRVFTVAQYVDTIHYRREKVCKQFASSHSRQNKGEVALVKVFFVSSRPEPEAIPLGG